MGRVNEAQMVSAILGPDFDTATVTDANGDVWQQCFTSRFSILRDMSGKYGVVVDKIMRDVYNTIAIAYRHRAAGGQLWGQHESDR